MSSYFRRQRHRSLAAAILLRDGDVGKDITILEESTRQAGASDAHPKRRPASRKRQPHVRGDVPMHLRSVRRHPFRHRPDVVTEETNRAAKAWLWDNKVRLLDGSVADAHAMGFTERDRIDLVALIGEPAEPARRQAHHRPFRPAFLREFLDGMVHAVRVRAVARAIEFHRYLRRFVQFSTIDVQHDIYRTVYNQYDSRSCRS
jgi:oleate hydratase